MGMDTTIITTIIAIDMVGVGVTRGTEGMTIFERGILTIL